MPHHQKVVRSSTRLFYGLRSYGNPLMPHHQKAVRSSSFTEDQAWLGDYLSSQPRDFSSPASDQQTVQKSTNQ
jgi:hypothetical protein